MPAHNDPTAPQASVPTVSPAVALALGLCHAALFVLAFPALAVWWLAPAAITPLCALALLTNRPLRDGLLAAAGTLPMWGYHQSWLVEVTVPGYPLLCLHLAMYTLAFVWLGSKLCGFGARRFGPPAWLSLALLWTGLEYFRAEVFLDGYPWYLLGHTPVKSTASAEPAAAAHLLPVVGVFGVSLLLALVGSIAAQGAAYEARWRRLTHAGVALAVGWAALEGLGLAARAGAPAGETFTLRLGVVQTNVPQDNKLGWEPRQRLEDFERFSRLTTELVERAGAEGLRPHVVLWPETMFPGVGLDAEVIAAERAEELVFRDIDLPTTYFYDALTALQQSIGAPMLVGALGHEGFRIDYEHPDLYLFDRKFNSVFMVAQGRAGARYDKLQLTPFGEVMPVISRSKWLESKLLALGAGGMRFDLDPGDAPVVFEVAADGGQTARIATPICFELTSSRIGRRVSVSGGARTVDVIAHVTNDGWFGTHRSTREQHAQIARVRAMELGVPVVRATNTGTSVAFDARGRMAPLRVASPAGAAQRIEPWTDGGAVVELAIPLDEAARTRTTPAARLGDVAGWGSLAVSLLLLAARWRQGRRATKMTAHEGSTA